MNRNIRRKVMTALVALAALTGCQHDGRTVRQTTDGSDTLYTADKALMIYGHEPERALAIIDSAEARGNIPDFQAGLLRAKVYSSSMEVLQLDTAQAICETLLEHDSIKADTDLRLRVIDQLINISRLYHNNEQWLHWATIKADLCREQAKTLPTEKERLLAETEGLRTEAEIGVILSYLGQRDEGLARINYAIDRLDHPGSISRLDALVIALKRKINVFQKQERPADVIPVARQIIDRLDQYSLHPEDYAEDSARLPADSADRACYLDFYRAQANAFIAMAWNSPRAFNRDSVAHYLRQYEQSSFSKTFAGRRMVARVRVSLGEYDKALASLDEQERQMKGDTINDDYADILLSRAEIAEGQGRLATALAYRRRYEALCDTLYVRHIDSKAHDYAARYQLQEQQAETEQQRLRARHSRIFAAFIAFILGGVIAVQVWVWRQKRAISRKNRVLARHITETVRLKNMFADDAGDTADSADIPAEVPSSVSLDSLSDEQLFRYIHNVIIREKLFLNPSFDRQALVDYLHLSPRQVGRAFAQGSDYASITSFINGCRLDYACDLLTNTSTNIDEVASASGFSVRRTFSRLFKERYGLTPSEYREQQRQK